MGQKLTSFCLQWWREVLYRRWHLISVYLKMPGNAAQSLEEIFRTAKKVRSGYGEEVTSTKKIPRQRSSPSQWHKQLGTGSVCSTICTMPSWWGEGQGGTTGSRCENQKIKLHMGSSSGNTKASLFFGRWRGCSTEPLPCCTPRSQDSNSCVLGYLCAHALNSHKAEPHPDSGQAIQGDRAPQPCTRAVTSNCLKMNLKHHLLHATIFFLLQSHYLLLQKSKWFLRRKQLANPSGLHPSGEVNADAGCVSRKSPVQTQVTSASSGFSPYFSAETGDCRRVWEEACVAVEADPGFTFCSILQASGQQLFHIRLVKSSLTILWLPFNLCTLLSHLLSHGKMVSIFLSCDKLWRWLSWLLLKD